MATHVEVQIRTRPPLPQRPEGRVVAIVTRGRTHLAGIVTRKSRDDTYFVYAPLLASAQQVIVETEQ